jgi:hypothetical protein
VVNPQRRNRGQDIWARRLTSALDPFTEQAAQMHADALQVAREAGRALGAVPMHV